MIDVILVTKDNYPTIFKAFELISHDGGRQAGHINYAVPIVYEKDLSIFEDCLSFLLKKSEQSFEDFCIGEEENRKRIVKEYLMIKTDEFLQRFSEEFS